MPSSRTFYAVFKPLPERPLLQAGREGYTSDVSPRPRFPFVSMGVLAATVAVTTATALSWAVSPLFERSTPIMTYLLAIVVVGARYGRVSSIVTRT